MKAKMQNYMYQAREVELAYALRPAIVLPHDGLAERADAQAERNADAIGELAALLVERKLITLDEAKTACGVYSEIELIEE